MVVDDQVASGSRPDVYTRSHPDGFATASSGALSTITALEMVGAVATTTHALFITDVIIACATAMSAQILVGPTGLASVRIPVEFGAEGGAFAHSFREPLQCKNPIFFSSNITATSVAIHGYTNRAF